MTNSNIPSELLDSIKDAAKIILEETTSTIKILSHHDADGMAAAAIMGTALCNAKSRPHIRIIHQLELSMVKKLETDNSATLIFLDFGSTQLEAISKLPQKNLIICDHHPPVALPSSASSENIIHVNPHLAGVDGTTEISASGVAYLVARAMSPINTKMADIALVGALGDRQDRGPKHTVLGLNQTILKWGIQEGVLEETQDLRFFGRETRPIPSSIEYTTDPFLPGLTGNFEKCKRFLDNSGIETRENGEWRKLSDLTQEERKILVTNLVVRMLEHGMDTTQAEQIVGTVYTLLRERSSSPLRDMREYAALLDACGKMRQPGLGVAVAMYDRSESFQLANNLANEYRRKLASAIGYLLDNPQRIQEDRQSFRYIRGNNILGASMMGTITSIAIINRIIPDDKPLVGLSEIDDRTIKVSARGTLELVERGLDLGAALRDIVASEKMTGEAGGHNVAAGARIPKGKETIFLDKLEIALLQQVERKEDGSEGND